jgi:hypothetical protein
MSATAKLPSMGIVLKNIILIKKKQKYLAVIPGILTNIMTGFDVCHL